MNKSRLMIAVLLVLGMVLLATGGGSARVKTGAGKFLVIHLDAVYSGDFFAALERGELPHLAEIFSCGQQVKYGLTLFPGGTETMLTRFKHGLDNSEGVVGWNYIEGVTGKKVTGLSVMPRMIGNIERRSRHLFLFGIPGIESLAGLALLNLDRLWETQNVVEYYWFHTDAAGHLFGAEAHLDSVRRFDHFMGLAWAAGKLEDVNIVLYTDHGMSMGTTPIHYNKPLRQLLGKELRYAFYPNLYLHHPEKKEELACLIAEQTEIDLCLIKLSSDLLRGYTAAGFFEIRRQNGRYSYQPISDDPFDYAEYGLGEVFLGRDEWLMATKDLLFPGVVPNIFSFLDNPNAGDIVFVFNPPKTPFTPQSGRGHHSGLKNTDLLVPLLFTGPAFVDVAPFEVFWLHEVFSEHLPMVGDSEEYRREKHTLSLSYPSALELSFSPAYRWRLGLTLTPELFNPWFEYDLYSSFYSRAWIGGGIAHGKPVWRLRLEGFVGPVGINWLKQSDSPGDVSLRIRLHETVEMEISRSRAGLTVRF